MIAYLVRKGSHVHLWIALASVIVPGLLALPSLNARLANHTTPSAVVRAARPTRLDELSYAHDFLRAALQSQSRRAGEKDATLGVIALFEMTVCTWLVEGTLHWAEWSEEHHKPEPHLHFWANIAVIAPIVIAALAALRIRIAEGPKPIELVNSLAQDRAQALTNALEGTVIIYDDNEIQIKAKERYILVSVVAFTLVLVAIAILTVLEWA